MSTTVQGVPQATVTGAPRRVLPHVSGGVVGVVLLVFVWTLIALSNVANDAVPTPWAMLRSMHEDGWRFYRVNAGVTLRGATLGFLWGNAAALGVAVLVLLLPRLETVAAQLAVISYCMPLVAIGPVVLVVFGGRTPTVVLAALSVFFTTLIGALLGLRSADRYALDVVRAYGGSRWHQVTKVQSVAALPAIISALQIAAPSAMLGAIIGEYLGGVDSGLGVVLTVSQQQLNVPRTWGLMAVTGLIAALAYAAFGLLGRFVTPWSTGRAAVRR